MSTRNKFAEHSFPVDERLKLPLHTGIFNWAARRPYLPTVGAGFLYGSTPSEIATGMGAYFVTYLVTAATFSVKTGVSVHQILGQYHDRAANRLLAKQDVNGNQAFDTDHPKVVAHQMKADSHRADFMDGNGVVSLIKTLG